jgi:hypothetical protein
LESKIDANLAQMFTQSDHYFGQIVAADMRSRIDQNVVRRAMFDEQLKHPTYLAAFRRTCVKLSVTISARTALSKAIIALTIYRAVMQYLFQIMPAGLHGFAAFDDYRSDRMASQFVRAK